MEEKINWSHTTEEEIIQRVGIEKLLFGDKYTTFLYNGLYVHIQKILGKTKVFFFVFLEKAYTSETWSALDNSQKLMSAYVSYKIDFQTIFG